MLKFLSINNYANKLTTGTNNYSFQPIKEYLCPFSNQLTLSVGIYTGMYISQNYEIPRVDEPSKIIDKIKEYADEHRKKSPAEELIYGVRKNINKIVD